MDVFMPRPGNRALVMDRRAKKWQCVNSLATYISRNRGSFFSEDYLSFN